MKNQKGFTIIELMIVIIFGVFGLSWIINAYKLTQCDFAIGEGKSFKCELVHGVGIIPVVAPVTVWVGTDE